MTTIAAERTLSRKTFVKGAGVLVVAIGAPRLLDPGAARAAVAGLDPVGIGPPAIDPSQIDSWIAVGSDGTVTMKTGKVELGQGTVTSSMQLVADELDVPFNSVKFVQSDTWFTPDQGATAGSQSTGTENGPAGVRQAAAEARLALLTMASTKLGAPVSNLTVSNGVVSVVGNPSQSVSYASLLGGATFNLPITGKATPKPYTAYKIVGTSVPRVDIPAKVFGTFTYSQDLKVPGMLYARVVRPPTLDSKLVSVDGWPSGKPASVVQVVQKNNYVAVVAKTEWDAIKGAGTLKVTWQVAPLPPWATYNDDLLKGPSQDVVIQDSKIRGSAVVPPGQDVDAVLDGHTRSEGDQPDIPLPDPDARIDGHVRLDGAGGQPASGGDGLVADAGDLSVAGDALDGARIPASEHPLHLHRGLGMLRGEPGRRHLARRRGHLADRRQADQGRLHARRRAVLGELRPGLHDLDHRRGRHQRPEAEGDRVEARRLDVDAGRPAGPTLVHRPGDPAGLPRGAVRPGRVADTEPGPQLGRRVKLGAGVHHPGGEAHEPHGLAHVPVGAAPLSGPNPDHVRERGDDGRARAPCRRRPGELPARPPAGLRG